jgi:hypothetical protein
MIDKDVPLVFIRYHHPTEEPAFYIAQLVAKELTEVGHRVDIVDLPIYIGPDKTPWYECWASHYGHRDELNEQAVGEAIQLGKEPFEWHSSPYSRHIKLPFLSKTKRKSYLIEVPAIYEDVEDLDILRAASKARQSGTLGSDLRYFYRSASVELSQELGLLGQKNIEYLVSLIINRAPFTFLDTL